MLMIVKRQWRTAEMSWKACHIGRHPCVTPVPHCMTTSMWRDSKVPPMLPPLCRLGEARREAGGLVSPIVPPKTPPATLLLTPRGHWSLALILGASMAQIHSFLIPLYTHTATLHECLNRVAVDRTKWPCDVKKKSHYHIQVSCFQCCTLTVFGQKHECKHFILVGAFHFLSVSMALSAFCVTNQIKLFYKLCFFL